GEPPHRRRPAGQQEPRGTDRGPIADLAPARGRTCLEAFGQEQRSEDDDLGGGEFGSGSVEVAFDLAGDRDVPRCDPPNRRGDLRIEIARSGGEDDEIPRPGGQGPGEVGDGDASGRCRIGHGPAVAPALDIRWCRTIRIEVTHPPGTGRTRSGHGCATGDGNLVDIGEQRGCGDADGAGALEQDLHIGTCPLIADAPRLGYTTALAIAARPSPRPFSPSPSAVVPETDTAAPTAADSTCPASRRRVPIFGRFPMTWTAMLPISKPDSRTIRAASASRSVPGAPASSGRSTPKC